MSPPSFLLRGADRENLNVRGAAIHVLGDLLGSVAALVAGAVIMLTGWTPIDPLLSMLVAAIIVRSGWQVVAASGHILLEGAPERTRYARDRPRPRRQCQGVEDVHHVHVWSITQCGRMVTLHAQFCDGADSDRRAGHQGAAQRAFGLDHATVEIERGECADDRTVRRADEPPLGLTWSDLSVDFRSGETVTHAVKHVSFDIGDGGDRRSRRRVRARARR